MLELFVATLAVWQIVNIWHHSALFSTWRARVELWDTAGALLLRCPYCLSVWVSLVVVLWLGLVGYFIGPRLPSLVLVLQAPIHALAVSRLANVFHDLMKGLDRTPKHNKLELVIVESSGAEQADAAAKQEE